MLITIEHSKDLVILFIFLKRIQREFNYLPWIGS